MQNHKAWLGKAYQDLKGAKVLYREDINDLAVHHAHQCAEKALKSFLVFKLVPIQKSHDLVLLTEQCFRYDPSFEELRFIVESLNPMGTLLRYPSDIPIPDQSTTKTAIENGENVLNFVKTKIKASL
jgi:HEPN domain-containing protein